MNETGLIRWCLWSYIWNVCVSLAIQNNGVYALGRF